MIKKYLFLPAIAICMTIACGKPCLECQYSTLKGPVQEKYCSTTKSDREAWEANFDSIAKSEGSKAFCEPAKY